MLPSSSYNDFNLLDYIKVIKKHASIILAFLIIIPTSVIIIDFLKPSIYRSTVSLLVEKTPPKITKFDEVYQQPQTGYSELQYYYQTQFKILQSRTLAERVFDELKLRNDPGYRDLKDPVGKMQMNIAIAPVRNSQIIMVNVEDTDALRASAIANTLAKVYIQQDIEMKNRASKEATGWLELQLTDIKKKMGDSERALNNYMQSNRIVTVPDVEKKTETLMENLKQEKSRLQTEISEAEKRYKEKHPKLIALKAQYQGTLDKIEKETTNLLDINQKLVEYNILKKEVDSNQALYTSMLSRAKETDISEKISASSIRIIDEAKPADAPCKPKKFADFILSVIVALGAGLGIIFVLEYLDATIHTSNDIAMHLDLPFLGYIPTTGKDINSDADRASICYARPNDKITELFRAIRTSILFASPEDKPLKIMLTTSSIPDEGKSFISANISEVFCHANERVILIDMDMRRPSVHKGFVIRQSPGMSNFLTGNSSLQNVIVATKVPNLFIIPSGDIPPNPTELISSGKIRPLFEELKKKYDRVIVDAPPILSVSDSSLLSNLVDGVIFVVKGSSTRADMALQAKEKILKAKGKIIGTILNNVQPTKEDSYYYHYYNEYGETENNKK